MNFGDARWLWGLLALPLLAALEWRTLRAAHAALVRLVGPRADNVLLGQWRPLARALGVALRLAALAALLIGAADPQWGRELVRRGATGSDVVMVIDVSASMDTRDVAPSRIEEARREALAVLDRLEGSRVGIVAFAGDAVRLCPLTLDRDAARLTLEGLGSTSVSTPGTDLGRALHLAAHLMPAGRREEQAVVLWTDGEDLERGGLAATDELAHPGVRVFAVGVGTPAGDIVPVLDDAGRAVDVKRDETGGPVRSRLDENLLRTIASRTGGAYFSASRPGGELPRLLAALSSLARSGRGQRLVERPVSQFPWFGLFAALLIAIHRARPRRRIEPAAAEEKPASAPPARRPRAPRAGSRAAPAAAALPALLLVLAAAPPASGQSTWARGDRAFKAARWAEAETLYAQRVRDGHPRGAEVNLATTRALLGNRARAEKDLGTLAGEDDAAGRVAGYNLGTSLAERRADEDALRELRRTLERDPHDRDARWNYEVVLRRQIEQRRKPPNPSPQGGGQQNPQSGTSGGGGKQPPTPSPGKSGPEPQAPTNPANAPPETGGATTGRMDRAQADQILNALEQQSRLQGHHQTRVMRERQGRDW